ncbi:MAG: valine--tRNA ligase [Bacteroidales bacterium]|nr:valine--tRNA ligase [Bacteroidales bacterium]HNW74756.1 valine--tRNA ligase [Bacteroidales bacterium]
MEIASKYNPALVEDKWYSYWLKNKLFHSEPDSREPYCIVIPPPNVTGVLHMGHMLNNTIQDVMMRRARMAGKNACWVPGTDHASIATEAKVVAKLKEDGIRKSDLTRDQFLLHAWEWKHKHGGIILDQLKKLGASCDWERTCFTMDDGLYDSVIKVFIDLYEKGLIYRGVRMVNWDPKALTAVSDEEVVYREVNSKLYYVRYLIAGTSDEWVTIATTRPETILGDTAICVHPEDEKYRHLKGKKIMVPLINRPIPVIFDEYVDREFGTGALKVTPAHDINDYKLGIKHQLEVIDTFNANGTMSEAARLFVGEDRFTVRKKIAVELEKQGHIVKIENYTNKVGYSERTEEVIEPRISIQWFLKMNELAKPALDLVENDTIRFHPAKYKNMYRHWMENVTDWCISRQLWWGHRIPAWYLPDGTFVVARSREEAFEQVKLKIKNQTSEVKIEDLKQDEDVLDTWFSSWLWPISVFDGIRNPDNPDIRYYYPTNELITAPEIIFFWVARMIMAGWEYRKEIPFRNVYFTGIVRDKLGRKMSKSLGNSPEPLDLIARNGADAIRVGMLLCSPAGNDLLYDDGLIEQGRNFCNKIWNAMRLVRGWQVSEEIDQPAENKIAIAWFASVFNSSLQTIQNQFSDYRLSEALMTTYKLIWDDYCSWFLEMIKPAYQQPIDRRSYEAATGFLDQLIRLLHPFMPFITEEIFHILKEREEGESILLTPQPEAKPFNQGIIDQFIFASEVIIAIRNVRKERNISFKEPIALFIKKNHGEEADTTFDGIIGKLCNLKSISYIDVKSPGCISFIVRSTEFFIPVGDQINAEEDILKIEEELLYTRGFLSKVMLKLNNESFIKNAPVAVVEAERKKQQDAISRIAVLEERITSQKG